MLYSDRTKPVEARLERVWDIEDCKALAHRHILYYCNNERERSLNELWVREPENAKTASFGKNWGFYIGMDEIRRWYVDADKPGAGFSSLRPMTSTALCVADDGKTAYGLWYLVSAETFGPGDAYWVSEMVAFDFVNEGGDWRIHRMFTAADMTLHPGDNLQDYKSVLLPGAPENPFKKPFGTPPLEFDAFRDYQYAKFPPVPVPHETYNLDNSCCFEASPYYGMPKSQGGAQ